LSFTVRSLIVDDEPLARQRIRGFIKNDNRLKIVGECTNGIQAINAIIKLKPNLIFLDIQIPGMNGFEVIQAVGAENMPPVIFVTAYDRYAIKAFEVHAIDYLLKPYEKGRFEIALERGIRAASSRRKGVTTKKIGALVDKILEERNIPERILVKSSDRISIVEVGQIDWIESAGNYVQIHLGKVTHLLRDTMKNMERRLDPKLFARIQRKIIVNMGRIKELRPLLHGDYVVVLHDGVRLRLSRQYSHRLGTFLGDI
jgi:two-component system LytT family response regulator